MRVNRPTGVLVCAIWQWLLCVSIVSTGTLMLAWSNALGSLASYISPAGQGVTLLGMLISLLVIGVGVGFGVAGWWLYQMNRMGRTLSFVLAGAIFALNALLVVISKDVGLFIVSSLVPVTLIELGVVLYLLQPHVAVAFENLPGGQDVGFGGALCPQCHASVQPDWAACPHCRTPLLPAAYGGYPGMAGPGWDPGPQLPLPPPPPTNPTVAEQRRERSYGMLVSTREGKRYELHRESQVGRDPQSAIVLNDLKVSANHAVIRRRGGQFFILDRGSRNGTFVNEQRIDRERLLDDGDRVRIGQTVLTFKKT